MSSILMRTALVLALVVPASAQYLNVTVTPSPAPQGVPITVTATDAHGLGLYSADVMMFASARVGTPSGPLVGVQGFGGGYPTSYPTCGSTPRTQTPNLWIALQPGLYWIEIPLWTAPFSPLLAKQYVPVQIEDATPDPVLAATNVPAIGTTFLMDITAPLHPSGSYVTAWSATTNAGFALGPLYMSLDIDPVFMLSFPNPLPGLLVNFQGNLDASGSASGIGISIPNLPFLQCFQLNAQALIIPPAGGASIETTNVLPFTMQ